MKKFLAGIMAAVLMVTSTAFTEVVYAEAGSRQLQKSATMVAAENELAVKGANSFGLMLANELSEEIDEQDSNDGCNIFSVEVTGKSASVSFETTEDATLVVAIYSEDGIQMEAFGKLNVLAGDTEAVVAIETDAMPQYFYLKGFLVDSSTLRPLCTVYESPNYTKEMQEFFTKDTDDFAKEGYEVLDLDGDKENNFAVYNKEVNIISGTGITVISADDTNNTYVFEDKGDQIKLLKQEDIFAYEYVDKDGNENILIVQVASINIDNNIVTIHGQDVSMEEVFEYVKIDAVSSSDTPDIQVDPSACGEGVTYNGIVKDSERMQLNAVELEGKLSKSLSYSLSQDVLKVISGDVEFKVEGSVKVYVSMSYQYLELKIDYSAKLNLKADGQVDKKLKLGRIGFSPVAGVYIEFTPSLIAKMSVAVSYTGKFSGTIGCSVDSRHKGVKNLTSSPKIDSELKGEIDIFLGLSLEPKLKIISDHVASTKLEAAAGVQVKGTRVVHINKPTQEIHECEACVEGDINAKVEVKFEICFLEIFTFETKASWSKKVADWHWSRDFSEFGFTPCPRHMYKFTVTVMDEKGRMLRNAIVDVPCTVIEAGTNTRRKVSSITTNDAGRAEGYLANGTYTAKANASGYKSAAEKIKIQNKPKSCGMKLKSLGGTSSGSSGSLNLQVSPNIQALSLAFSHSGAVMKDGSLYMWGSNWYGQLGDGTTEDKNVPVKIMDNVKSISLGGIEHGAHSGAITKDGSLYMWGNNGSGQLGDGTCENRSVPVKILEDVICADLGEVHSGAITKDGSLYMWGHNLYGQLGDGTTTDRYKPVKVLDNAIAVSLGKYYSGAVTKDGSLYMWGFNWYGQLGDGTRTDRLKPVKVMDNVAALSLGGAHSGAITRNGSLYVWGLDAGGRLGFEDLEDYADRPTKLMDDVVSVKFGADHSGAVTKDGSLYMWGLTEYGRLGNGVGDESSCSAPVKVLSNVAEAALGSWGSGAITKDGSLYMWGYNGEGQLGDGTTENKYLPVKTLSGIKVNNKKTDASRIETIPSMDENVFSLKGIGYLMPTETLGDESNKTAVFANLTPNAVYNFFVMRDKLSEDALNSSNLLYLTQATASVDGKVSVTYAPTENAANADVFLISAKQQDLSSAKVTVSDLEYNQELQYIQPAVSYEGEILTEFEDYELLGDYSAAEIGDYVVTIHGIGAYKGSINVPYKIKEVSSRKIEKLALSIQNVSLNAGRTLQLQAQITPANATNKTLKWSSSDEKVAIVDSNGLVTAVGTGSATITVESQDGSGTSASCVITVTRVSGGGSSGGNTSGGNSNGGGNTSGSNTADNNTAGDNSNNGSNSPSNNTPNDQLQVKLLYYIVAFNANGGKSLSRKTMTLLMDDTLGILPKVQRKNYIFKGWYTQKSNGDKVSSVTVLNASTTLYAQWTRVAKPSKVKMLTLTSTKKGQLKVAYKKINGAKGYEIAYSANKNFKSAATKKVVTASNKKTLTKLKTGKKYYVRVRAYKMDSTGKKIYGAYSTVNSIKVK